LFQTSLKETVSTKKKPLHQEELDPFQNLSFQRSPEETVSTKKKPLHQEETSTIPNSRKMASPMAHDSDQYRTMLNLVRDAHSSRVADNTIAGWANLSCTEVNKFRRDVIVPGRRLDRTTAALFEVQSQIVRAIDHTDAALDNTQAELSHAEARRVVCQAADAGWSAREIASAIGLNTKFPDQIIYRFKQGSLKPTGAISLDLVQKVMASLRHQVRLEDETEHGFLDGGHELLLGSEAGNRMAAEFDGIPPLVRDTSSTLVSECHSASSSDDSPVSRGDDVPSSSSSDDSDKPSSSSDDSPVSWGDNVAPLVHDMSSSSDSDPPGLVSASDTESDSETESGDPVDEKSSVGDRDPKIPVVSSEGSPLADPSLMSDTNSDSENNDSPVSRGDDVPSPSSSDDSDKLSSSSDGSPVSWGDNVAPLVHDMSSSSDDSDPPGLVSASDTESDSETESGDPVDEKSSVGDRDPKIPVVSSEGSPLADPSLMSDTNSDSENNEEYWRKTTASMEAVHGVPLAPSLCLSLCPLSSLRFLLLVSACRSHTQTTTGPT
jgi:hypothetical protein